MGELEAKVVNRIFKLVNKDEFYVKVFEPSVKMEIERQLLWYKEQLIKSNVLDKS